MNNIIIIYKSKYGSTRRYAYAIKEKLKCDIYSVTEIKKINFEKYKVVIYGGRVLAGNIDGLSFFVTSFKDEIIKKKFCVFAVGCSSYKSIEKIEKLKGNNIFPEFDNDFFYFMGTLDFKKLKFIDRVMFNMIKSKISKIPKVNRNEDENIILESFNKKIDFFDENVINSLIENVKAYSS